MTAKEKAFEQWQILIRLYNVSEVTFDDDLKKYPALTAAYAKYYKLCWAEK